MGCIWSNSKKHNCHSWLELMKCTCSPNLVTSCCNNTHFCRKSGIVLHGMNNAWVFYYKIISFLPGKHVLEQATYIRFQPAYFQPGMAVMTIWIQNGNNISYFMQKLPITDFIKIRRWMRRILARPKHIYW